MEKTARSSAEADTPVGEYLLERLRQLSRSADADQLAQIDSRDGSGTTFSELLEQSVRAAAGWRALGLRRGHQLGVYSWNRRELLPAILGALFEGVSVVLILPFAKSGELRHYLSLADVKVLLSEAALIGEAVEVTGSSVAHVSIGTVDVTTLGPDVDVRTLDDVLHQGDQEGLDSATYAAAVITDCEDHVPVVTYSSGTSGLPKCVHMADRGLSACAQDLGNFWGGRAGETVLLTHPLSWVTGLLTCTGALTHRATVVLHNYVDERVLLNTIVRYKVTSWLTVPPRLILLAQLVDGLRSRGEAPDTSSLRYVRTTGASLVGRNQKYIVDVLGVPVVQMYGCTEVSLIASYPSPVPGQPFNPTPGAVGPIVEGARIRLVDVDSGRDVLGEPGRRGEVRALTPFMMKGYWGSGDVQAAAYDEQGFYRTGDVAYLDENGDMHIVDRIKELITYDEFDVAPGEVEAVLTAHPAVREACVVGRKHDRLDELPTAFVVLKEAAAVTERQLQDLVAGSLADHKRLRGGVFFVNEIPKSTYGKVLRSRLKDRLRDLPPVEDEFLV